MVDREMLMPAGGGGAEGGSRITEGQNGGQARPRRELKTSEPQHWYAPASVTIGPMPLCAQRARKKHRCRGYTAVCAYMHPASVPQM